VRTLQVLRKNLIIASEKLNIIEVGKILGGVEKSRMIFKAN
jgi:hypothetical protein